MQAAIMALVFFSVLFAVFGIWLLVGQHSAARDRIGLRLGGVKQVKQYELGDALAENRERQLKRQKRRKEALKRKVLSDIPTIDKAHRKVTWAEKLSAMLVQAQIPISVKSLVAISLVLAGIGAAVTGLWRREFDPALATMFALAMGVVPYAYVLLKVGRRIKKFNNQLPDALDLLSSGVKGGQSLNAAIQNIAEQMPDPVADEFRIVTEELAFGVDFDDALKHLTVRVNTPDVQFFASALMIQKETGGNLSEVLDGLQKTIRERFRILGQVKTLTAQGKLSGLIVGLLPIVLGGFIYFANPEYMGDLFTTTYGRYLLMGAGGSQLLGVFLIYKIVNIKV